MSKPVIVETDMGVARALYEKLTNLVDISQVNNEEAVSAAVNLLGSIIAGIHDGDIPKEKIKLSVVEVVMQVLNQVMPIILQAPISIQFFDKNKKDDIKDLYR